MAESVLVNFDGSNGANPNASVFYYNGILYGTTVDGGNDGHGALFSYEISSGNLTTLLLFNYSDNGAYPYASVIYQDGILYGTTFLGGSGGYGTLFSYNISSTILSTLYPFGNGGANGSQCTSSLIFQDGIIYGTTSNGGSYNSGTLFSYNKLSPGNIDNLYYFTGGSDGGTPNASLTHHNGILYGTTSNGGSYNSGTLFSYNKLSPGNIDTLYHFGSYLNDGRHPNASVLYHNGKLYGTTYDGGSNISGTLFSYDISPSGSITILYHFGSSPNDGRNPSASVLYHNEILYGTTSNGGIYDYGTLFSYNLTSNTLSFLHNFGSSPNDGKYPFSAVIYQDGILYGTTQNGGSSENGTLYSYKLVNPPTQVKPEPKPTPTPNKPKPNKPTPLPISNICFPAGTLISTDQGNILIEKIIPFENTINRKMIHAITKTITNDNYLVCFYKNALGKNYPDKDTIISKQHKIFYRGKMIEAYKFLNRFEKVKKVDYNQEILYNVLMNKYEKIKVNNIICESLHPNNIIAKLYNSNYDEEYKNKIICIMNESINKNDRKSYMNIVKRITN
jgi:uncharacterized repeat protein (TIGR03803 family)